jgi:hypothetical protein
MSRHRCPLLSLSLAILLGSTTFAIAQFPPLLRRVPEQANAILLMDLDALKSSRIGIAEKWAAKHKENHLAGVSTIPPNVQQLVVAANINHSTLHDTWKIAIAQLGKSMNVAELAGAEHGSVDKVAGQSVVLSPRNAYYVPFAPKVAGMMRPANRQELAPYYGYGYSGPWGSGYGWGQGYYPGTGFASNYTALGNAQGIGEMNERGTRQDAWNQINAATTQVRRAMTEKYQVEF